MSTYTVNTYEEGCGPHLVQITDDLNEAKQTAHEIFNAACDSANYPDDDAWVEEWQLGGPWYESQVVYRVSERPEYVMPREQDQEGAEG